VLWLQGNMFLSSDRSLKTSEWSWVLHPYEASLRDRDADRVFAVVIVVVVWSWTFVLSCTGNFNQKRVEGSNT